MSSERKGVFDREGRLGEVPGAYFQALAGGRGPTGEESPARHPDLPEGLTAFFADREAVNRWTELLRPGAGSARLAGADPDMTREAPGPGAPEPAPGLADYELRRELGRGGMGVVYEARQRSLNRLVALKVVRAGEWASEAERQRFRNEAEIVAHLDHAHVIPIYEVGEADGRLYFSMRLAEGGSLAQHLPRFAADPRAAARLVAEVARAVHHAHQRGVLHRDLKPSNILLDGAGRSHVSDFGLAKRVEADSALTESGALVGTPSYMAPEQASRPRAAVTTATDVYGLGAVLYALLTGRPPFRADTPVDTMLLVREQEPAPPRALNPKVDRDLESICLKCLEKEPERRYGSAEALVEDLGRWLRGEPTRARPVRWWYSVWRWCRRNRLLSASLAAVAALLGLMAAVVAAGAVLLVRSETEALCLQRDKARAEQAAAREKEQAARRLLYAAHIDVAARAWENADPRQALEQLQQCAPADGEGDLRGFEWYYLRRLFQGGGQARLTLREHRGDVYCAAFSPDGNTLATAGQDRTIRLWDPADGRLLATLRGHAGDVNWAAFSPDGKALASAGDDGAVKLWDVATGREVAQLLQGPVQAIVTAFSPDGRMLAAGLQDGTVRRWDLPSRQERPILRAHDKRIESLGFSPDCRTLGSAANEVRLWDAATGTPRRLLDQYQDQEEKFDCVCFARRGPLVASAGRHVKVWDAATGRVLLVCPGHLGTAQSVAFSPDDQLLATAGDDTVVRLWEVPSGKMRTLLTGHTSRVWCAAFSPDGRTLATASGDGTVRLWDLARRPDSQLLWCAGLEGYRLAFTPDGKTLVGGPCPSEGLPTPLRLWDSPSGQLVASVPACPGVHSLACSPDSRSLATGHGDGTVTVWDLPGRRKRLTFAAYEKDVRASARGGNGRRKRVASLAFTPDGGGLLTNGDQCWLRQWDAATGAWRRDLTPPDEEFGSLAVSPDGQLAATSHPRGRLALWSLAAGRFEVNSPGPDSGEWGLLQFSPDGATLASANDRRIFLWDVQERRLRATLLGHRVPVACVCFSPDGRTLASGDREGKVKLWQVRPGLELCTLEGHQGGITSIAFSPDGRVLATAGGAPGSNGEIYLWRGVEGCEPPRTSGGGAGSAEE